MARMASLFDVAKKAGVSHITVSRVMNDKGNVAEKTKTRILKAVEKLGYRPNAAARALSGNMARAIGIAAPETDSVFNTRYFIELLRGVEKCCYDRSFNMVLSPRHSQGIQADFTSPFMERIADGVLVISPLSNDSRIFHLLKKKIPFIAVDAFLDEEIPAKYLLNFDHEGAAVLAVEHLISSGHWRIGHVTGMMDVSAGPARLKGYKKALKSHGIDFDPSLVITGKFDERSGHAAGKIYVGMEKPPTAVFAGNDFTAMGVIKACQEAGWSVPGKMSVIGTDDLVIAEYSNPPLTTIRQPIFQIGFQAASRLIDLIEKKKEASAFPPLQAELVVRSSVKILQGRSALT